MGNQNQNQQKEIIKTFVLGNKELDGKTAEFQYDHGWYTIFDIIGEEKNVVFKSKNAQESYAKWNVYIGRKKERIQREILTESERENDKKRQQQENRHGDKKNSDKKRGKQSEPDQEEAIVEREKRDGEKHHNHNHNRNRNRNHNRNHGKNVREHTDNN